MTENTILLVGSAPSYAHGVVDPIEELGRIALERGVLFHVDACMGGFLLPYFRRLGRTIAPFDFSVPGVTSMSVDLHKYAYASKGASLVLHKDKSLRRHQIFACSAWTGYSLVNTTVQSTKSGGPLAAAWAVLHFVGDDGYVELARRALQATDRLLAGVRRIPDLYVLGEPEMSLVSFSSETVSAFHIADEMQARRWHVQPQLTHGTSRANIHLTVGAANDAHIDGFIGDLRVAVDAARGKPVGQLSATVSKAFAGIDPAALTDDAFGRLLGMAGVQGTALPGRMADVNEILDALPPAIRNRLLTEFVNQMSA
jgi:glutamate/tyrosine decarboxylase-like PLP-dependent enzyme